MSLGPIILSVAGDQYTGGGRINVFVWEGATTAGDTVLVTTGNGPTVFWSARADGSNTYLGINLGPKGLYAPDGFRLAQISAGKVYVYLQED